MKPMLIRLANDETIHDLPFNLYYRLGFGRRLQPQVIEVD